MTKHIHLHHDESPLKEAIVPPGEERPTPPSPTTAQAEPAQVDPVPVRPETSAPEADPQSQPETETEPGSAIKTDAKPDPESIREQILSEIQEQEALEEFRQTRPDMWLQVMRLGHLLELQEEFKQEIWPEGSCFLYASVPENQSFCVRRVLDVDLETCTVALNIYADEDLEEGTVLLPLESIAWFGFPKNAVRVGRKRLRGFTAILGD